VTTATDDLAERMKRLDEAAVGEFSRAFGPRLWYFFLKRGLSWADAEALAVTCVTKTWLNIESFQPQGPGSFERWVFRLAKHIWIDDARRAGKRPSVGVNEHGLEADSEAPELVGNGDIARQVQGRGGGTPGRGPGDYPVEALRLGRTFCGDRSLARDDGVGGPGATPPGAADAGRTASFRTQG
jgi:hypothetical protein